MRLEDYPGDVFAAADSNEGLKVEDNDFVINIWLLHRLDSIIVLQESRKDLRVQSGEQKRRDRIKKKGRT